jgi:hypothetical protein
MDDFSNLSIVNVLVLVTLVNAKLEDAEEW